MSSSTPSPSHPEPAGPRPAVAPLRTAAVAGLPVAVTSIDGAVDWLTDWIARGRGGVSVRLVNAYSIVSAHADPEYLRLMTASGVSLPDGWPVAAAQRMLGGQRAAGRVRGPDFFPRVLQATQHGDTRHFFLGTTPGTLRLLQHRARRLWPEVTITGTYSPPFGEPGDAFVEECARRVTAAGADCVWIALGTPKQDLVADRLSRLLPVPCVAVGAAFDFVAGTKRPAPRMVQRFGAEWLYRLASEPRRLWRRYLMGNVRFLLLLARHGGATGRVRRA